MFDISIRDMMAASVHFGHRTRFRHPSMDPYIFGVRQQLSIINLDKTKPLLEAALSFASSIIEGKGKIVFVGTKRAAQDLVREQAMRCGMPYVNKRWLGGMLTNYKTIRQSIKRLKDIEVDEGMGKHDDLSKKERLRLDREKMKLEAALGGIKDMGGLPEAIFVIDVGQEKIAIQEANKLGIPVIGVVDTNCNPEGIDYIIPGNDDSLKAIAFYTQMFADVIEAVQQRKREEDEMHAKRRVVSDAKPVKAVAKPAKSEAKPAKSEAKKPATKKADAKKAIKAGDSK